MAFSRENFTLPLPEGAVVVEIFIGFLLVVWEVPTVSLGKETTRFSEKLAIRCRHPEVGFT